MTGGKTPAEIERANRMFAIENAVKLGPGGENAPAPIEHAKQFFEFLQENPAIERVTPGFNPNPDEGLIP